MPDALYQFARRTLRQRRERGIARVAVGGPHTDLDQFVRGERTVEFGDDEADIKSGLLSFSSPIARGLIGKSEGDVVDVTTPGGTRSYEIVRVRYV